MPTCRCRPRGTGVLGTRAELKNINSFRFVQRAIEHEIVRQARILDDGGTIVQETRLWDADAGISAPMRSKEEANDYRYFPDPDLPPLHCPPEDVDRVRGELPELPMARYRRLRDDGLSDDDARTLTGERDLSDYFDSAVAAYGGEAKAVANWVLSELLRELNKSERTIGDCPIAPAQLAALVQLVDDGTISGKIGKQVFATMFATGDDPAAIVEREGLRQVSDSGAIEAMCAEVIAANPGQAEAYRGGKEKLIGFFVGQVMKASRGQANPQATRETLEKLLRGNTDG